MKGLLLCNGRQALEAYVLQKKTNGVSKRDMRAMLLDLYVLCRDTLPDDELSEIVLESICDLLDRVVGSPHVHQEQLIYPRDEG